MGTYDEQTFSLDNERGKQILNDILLCDNFDLTVEEIKKDIGELGLSDTNKDNVNLIRYNMIQSIEFINPTLGRKYIQKIYCDNESFYKYNINKTFVKCEPLKQVLLNYQITNYLKKYSGLDQSFKGEYCDMFIYKCLTWALKMSGKINDKTIKNIKINCYKRYIPQDALYKIGKCGSEILLE